ncbi:MAG: DNA primase large subunit PriL [Pyrobaculum sp.]
MYNVGCDLSTGELSCYFPFLNKSSMYLAKRGYLLDVVLSDKQIISKSIERVKAALIRQSINKRVCIDEPEQNAVVARLALYIAAATRNRQVLRKFADFESKQFTEFLRKVPGLQDPMCKIEIAKDLGIVAKDAREITSGVVVAVFKTPIAVRWSSYLKYAPQDPRWAMINRPVIRGWVIMPLDDFERLLEEAYEENILKIVESNELAVGKVASEVDLSPLEEIIKKFKPVTTQTYTKGGKEPPCMKAILDALKTGENISHTARFAIAAYLLKRGWDVEQIVDIFKSAPDFDEKITRYQVQHIAGQVGGRKGYSVPNCETMNTWGLCTTNLGCGIKNPLQYGIQTVKKSS